jgi:subtilisin family serine protease
VLTRHPWVVPVAAYGRDASPLTGSNLGWSIGMRGLGAPGEDVLTLGRSGKPVRTSGTSIATPIVAGAAALIWSAFPSAPAAEVRRALVGPLTHRRSIAPPLLAAEAAYQRLSAAA